MKTTNTRVRQQGSVLMTTLVITGILGLTLASYLTMVSNQNRSVWRSQSWNATIPIAEAGIEEAIVHLNKNCLDNDITHTVVNWNADGWTSVEGGVQMTRWLGENHYVVTILTNSPYSNIRPAILSEGYVPGLMSYAPQTVLAVAGIDESGAPTLGRKIRVTTRNDGFIVRGLVARDSINLNGNGVTTDSFDSEDPAYNTGGLYDPAKNKDNGDVAVNYGLADSLGLGNANIFGSIAVGPGGSISIGPNGKVGDKTWNASHSGIQPGRSRDDMNVSFPSVEVPFSGGYSVPTGRTVTNTIITGLSFTNTSASYPTDPGIVITNTFANTTTAYPVSGTYIGSVMTNTSYQTTVSFPGAGSYLGDVVTNTASATTTAVPTSGTYLGGVMTNTVWTTTTNLPSSNLYIGSVTTNYVNITSYDMPAAGAYVPGSLVANYIGGSGKTRNYTYTQISSYSYAKIKDYTVEKIASFSYFGITGYTVAKIASYGLIKNTFTTNYMAKTYDYVLDSGNYQISSLGGDIMILGDAVLYVTSDFNPNSIQINSGARLKIYNAAPSFKVSGNTFINVDGKADRLWYYGLSSNKNIQIEGNAGFIGVIYAPQADMTLGGGGNDVVDVIGATVTKTAKLNGHFNFHYDESLAQKGPSRGFIINSWDEIRLSDTE